MQSLPAEHALSHTIAQHRERFADVTEDGSRRSKPSIGRLCSRDAIHGTFQPAEIRPVTINESGRQAGDRAGAGNNRDAGAARLRIQLTNGRHEFTCVGQVQIVGAARDRRPGHPMILELKRARGMDHNLGAKFGKPAGDVSVDIDRAAACRICGFQICREGIRFCLRPPADKKRNVVIGRQRACNISAKIAVPADDQDFGRHDGFITIKWIMISNAMKAGQPSANHQDRSLRYWA